MYKKEVKPIAKKTATKKVAVSPPVKEVCKDCVIDVPKFIIGKTMSGKKIQTKFFNDDGIYVSFFDENGVGYKLPIAEYSAIK